MAYCRWSDADSDIYVYKSSTGVVCMGKGCKDHVVELRTYNQTIQHIAEHIVDGHKVPLALFKPCLMASALSLGSTSDGIR